MDFLNFDRAADSQLATLKQAGQILQTTRATIYRRNKEGLLPFVRIGTRQPRIRIGDLRQLIAGTGRGDQ